MSSPRDQRDINYRLLAEQVPAVLWSMDRDLRFLSSTGAGLAALGLEPGQVVGLTIYEYLQTEDRDDPAVAAHMRALAGESVEWEAELVGRVFHTHCEPIRDETGAVVGVVGIALDVTSRREAQDEANRFFGVSLDVLAITGSDGYFKRVNPEFERMFRIQQNTMEQLVVFIPALWMFAYFVNPLWGAGLGVVFIVGRFIYRSSYLKDPASRGSGFTITFLPTAVMLVWTLVLTASSFF